MTPNLHDYDQVLISSSAGKDSQCMLDVMAELIDATGYPVSKVQVVHANMPGSQWEGVSELAARQARFYGFGYQEVQRIQTLLEQVRQRGMWPSPSARYCTSDHKRDQVAKLFTLMACTVSRLNPQIKILHCMGLRAEESPTRAKRPQLSVDNRATTGRKHVDTYLPIQHMTTAQVWERIRKSGCPWHPAYDLGMPRLSCPFCIYADRDALMLAGKHNYAALCAHVEVEKETGHSFKQDLSLASIKEALDAGEEPSKTIQTWLM